MTIPKRKLFGREKQLEQIHNAITNPNISIINFFGPGGIGKTEILNRLANDYFSPKMEFSLIDGSYPNLDPLRILYQMKEQLKRNSNCFSAFERDYTELLVLQDILNQSGGVNALFDSLGQLKDPTGLVNMTASLGKSANEEIRKKISNRYSIERYMRGIDTLLVRSFIEGISDLVDINKKVPVILSFDTYESIESLDEWFSSQLIANLPDGVKVIIFGRNSLIRINYQWNDFGSGLITTELPELDERDAKSFLVHYGLRDPKKLERIYKITGGYPLLLVLARHLALQAGGWQNIDTIDNVSNRDYLASELLQRILREEKTKEIRDFLEKGVVATWFNPEIISVILSVPISESRIMYDKLRRHSFIEHHPYGLKFHDKIREILCHRLKFTDEGEFHRVTNLLLQYHSKKSGIKNREG